MAKNKLFRFREMKTMPNVAEFMHTDIAQGPLKLKGQWNSGYFKNNHPLVLELGCGKGEYTVNLAKRYPEKNFIGIDVKGSRMYVGARDALDNEMKNVAFLRTRIDFITSCFAENEVDEIWITFPDPQPQKPRKRLTSHLFLSRYRHFLKPGGIIHLKTDSVLMHDSTLEVIAQGKHELIEASRNIYHDGIARDLVLTEIQTTYEKKYLAAGKPITYLSFRLGEEKLF
ncbi:MAG: tRNA (guanosine(46)-N7)-methyltransferase TrmB [Bacteroidia bacterium]|jgi:tRNA (guanine-N7-)-methyltransferase|nr:tRNA (guanosine(46)-N7)-methyltransferase TrmB [Bacteroidia bacterium]